MTTEAAPTRIERSELPCHDGVVMALDLIVPAGGEGPWPLTVVSHGFKGFRRWGMFPHLAERLASRGRAVALFDLSHNGVDGCGDEPEAFTRLDLFERQTVSRHLADVGTVLDAVSGGEVNGAGLLDLTGGVSFVGHSLGGGLGVLRAGDDGRITRLALLNAVCHFERLSQEALDQLAREGYASIPNQRTGQVMRLGQAWLDDLGRHDLEASARSLSVPTLVVQGLEDATVSPEEGRRLVEWISGAELYPVEGADHTFGAKHPWLGWSDGLSRVVDRLDAWLPRVEPSP